MESNTTVMAGSKRRDRCGGPNRARRDAAGHGRIRNSAAPPQQGRIPVIMLTARGEDVDRIVGLELGADDYLAKPFNPRELAARIRAILRRMNRVQPTAASK